MAKAATHRFLAALGLKEIPEAHPYKPYEKGAIDFVKEHLQVLSDCTGGSVGPGPASIVCTAAMQLACSRYVHDLGVETQDPKLLARASMLGNDSRQNLLAAYELARREGENRKDEKNPFAAFYEKDSRESG